MKHRLLQGMLLLAAFFPLPAGEPRAVPLDMYLIIDGSPALQNREGALRWLCDYAVDGLLQNGDRLSIWVAGGKARRIFSGTLGAPHTKESVKTLIRAVAPENAPADFIGALREVSGSTAAGGDRRITYTLLVDGSGMGLNSTAGTEMANLLRYSRVQEFAGWRAVVTAPDIGPLVRRAASAYMN